jgi:hypothetical protein
LILRHQLAILQRRQPRRPNLNWADRALLAILLSVIPKTRRPGLRLLVTPSLSNELVNGPAKKSGKRASSPEAIPITHEIRGQQHHAKGLADALTCHEECATDPAADRESVVFDLAR